jgi:hypothetical protein
MSGMNTYTGTASEVASLVLTFADIDPSGSLMKLSQMIKIFTRFRFFDINFGVYLDAYFESSAKKFDPPSSKSQDEIASGSKTYYGNLTRKKIA